MNWPDWTGEQLRGLDREMNARSHERLMILRPREDRREFMATAERNDGTVRIALPSDSFALTNTWRVSLFVFDGKVTALGLARSARWVSDFDRQVEIRHLQQVSTATPLTQLAASMKRGLGRILLASESVIPDATAREAERQLDVLAPGSATIFTSLRQAQLQPTLPRTPSSANVLEQRDSVSLALAIAGMDPEALLGSIDYDASRPFLRSVTAAQPSEAARVRHDASRFCDWLPVNDERYDVWRFEDPTDSNRKVTVLYADKEPLELVTGTDLIYYREESGAFVLVQYKRMVKENSTQEPVYRPDQQLEMELARMRAPALSKSEPTGVANFRLSQEPFYIKLLDPESIRPGKNRLAKGMYFPVSLFDLVRSSDEVRGPRGGPRVTWQTAQRYLTNSDFLTLLKGSWIGSQGSDTNIISELIQRALDRGRAAVIAVEHSGEVGDGTTRKGL